MLAPYGHVEDLEEPPPLDATLAVLQDSLPVLWRCFEERNSLAASSRIWNARWHYTRRA